MRRKIGVLVAAVGMAVAGLAVAGPGGVRGQCDGTGPGWQAGGCAYGQMGGGGMGYRGGMGGGPGWQGGPGPHGGMGPGMGPQGGMGKHGGMGPGMAGGPGMGMGGGMMFGPHLEALKPQLKLNAEQETRWAAATKQAEQMRQSGLANRDKMREEMRAELAKPAPDLGRIAALGDSVRSSQQALRQQTRDAWLQLYNSFTPEQKLVVRDAMLAATERGPHMRGRGAGPRA